MKRPLLGVKLLRGFSASPATLADVAHHAEDLGFDSLWINEHTVVPALIRSRYPFTPDGIAHHINPELPYADAMLTLAYVAAQTKRIRLVTGVIPLLTRHPLTLAKQAATLDQLSNGRLELGLGAGWLLEEGHALGLRTDARAARLDEAIEIIRLAWTRPYFEYHGSHFDFDAVGVHPQPVQNPVPLWIGGTGARAIQATVRHAVGNYLWLPSEATVAGMSMTLRSQRADLHIAASILGSHTVSESVAAIDRLCQLGVDQAVLVLPQDDLPRMLDYLVEFRSRFRD